MNKNIKIIGFSFIPNHERPHTSQTYIVTVTGFSTPTNLMIVGEFMGKKALVEKLQKEYLYDDVEITTNASKQIAEWEGNLKSKEEAKEPVAPKAPIVPNAPTV